MRFKQLPTRFFMNLGSVVQVLEACLDHISAAMAVEVQALEADSTAALDSLAQRVTAGYLDAVRRVKNRMVRLNTRVETVRNLLEKYLADDGDLAELHLTGQR
jgi:magnesium transporter